MTKHKKDFDAIEFGEEEEEATEIVAKEQVDSQKRAEEVVAIAAEDESDKDKEDKKKFHAERDAHRKALQKE